MVYQCFPGQKLLVCSKKMDSMKHTTTLSHEENTRAEKWSRSKIGGGEGGLKKEKE